RVVWPELLAKPVDVDVNGALEGIAMLCSVQRVQQHLPREHAAPGLDQRHEQAEFRGCHWNRAPGARHLDAVEIDHELAVLDSSMRRRRSVLTHAPEDRFDSDD